MPLPRLHAGVAPLHSSLLVQRGVQAPVLWQTLPSEHWSSEVQDEQVPDSHTGAVDGQSVLLEQAAAQAPFDRHCGAEAGQSAFEVQPPQVPVEAPQTGAPAEHESVLVQPVPHVPPRRQKGWLEGHCASSMQGPQSPVEVLQMGAEAGH